LNSNLAQIDKTRAATSGIKNYYVFVDNSVCWLLLFVVIIRNTLNIVFTYSYLKKRKKQNERNKTNGDSPKSAKRTLITYVISSSAEDIDSIIPRTDAVYKSTDIRTTRPMHTQHTRVDSAHRLSAVSDKKKKR